MSKKQIKFLIPLGALLLTLVLLTGCRPSDALTRLMNAMNALNPSTEEMKTEDEEDEDRPDDQMDPIDEQRDDAQINETEEMIGQMLEDMDWETAQEALMTVYSASATSNEWGAQQYNPDRLTYGSGGALVLNVSGDEINSASKMAGSGEGNGNGTASVIEASEERDDNDLDAVDTDLPLDSNQSANTPPTGTTDFGDSDDDNSKYIAGSSNNDNDDDDDDDDDDNFVPDDDGGSYTPPEYTNAGKRIAATGEMAIVVCMLDGADRLCATSVSFDDNWLAQEAFNSNGQMEYEPLWSGDGSYWLDNGDPDGDTFKYLMEYLQPDICFDFNYTSFSPEQADRMSDYNVTYVTMAAMTSRDNISACLRTVANYMDGSESGPALNIVGNYETWVTNELSGLGYIETTKETVFIEAWDDNVKTRDEYGNTLVEGAAVIKIGRNCRALTDYLLSAKVYDWAASPHVRGYTLKSSSYGYGATSGGVYGRYLWFEGFSTSTTVSGDMCYVTPVYDFGLTGNGVSTQSIWFTDGQYKEIDSTTREGEPGGLSFGNVFPGASDWGTVIAKDNDIAKKLQENEAWKDSGSDTWSLSRLVGDNNRVTYSGVVHSVNGVSYSTTIEGNYSVLVNPSGMGDWVEGSPESVLEAIWAAGAIQGYYGNNWGPTVRYKIQDFYNQFYGLNLDPNGPEIDSILYGK